MIDVQTSAIRTPTFLIASVFDSPGTQSVSGGGTLADALDGNTYDFWELTSTSGHAQMELSAAETVDCLCIAAHDLGAQGASIEVQYDTGGGYTTLGASFSPSDDSAIMMLLPSQSAPNWRVGVSGAASAPRIGVLMLGERLTLPVGLVDGYTPTDWAEEIDVLGGQSRSGQFLGQRIERRGGSAQINPGLIDRTWWEANGGALRLHYNEAKPFFYAGAPSIWAKDIAYCWRPPQGRPFRPSVSNLNYVATSMEVEFYA